MSIQIKTAFDYIKRSPFQAASAISVLTLTFFVATILAVLVYASSNVLKYFETRPQVIAFLKPETTAEQVQELQNKLTSDTRIKSIKYVPKEAALEIYKEATSDNPLLGELVSPSIFPASLEFSVTELSLAQDVIDAVKSESVVDSVGFTAAVGGESNLENVISRLKSITYYIRIGGIVFLASLGTVSLLVLLVIIGMRLSARKSEIEILNLIGATPGFIRSPIIFEATIYCMVGVFLGWVFSFIVGLYLTPAVISYFGQIPILPKDLASFAILYGVILAGEIIIGLILALLGGTIAFSRAYKNR